MRRLLASLVVVQATGCGNLLKLEYVEPPPAPDGPIDGVTADRFVGIDCSLSPFPQTTPTRLEELANKVAGDPALTENELELYYVRSGISPFEIWRASRTTTSNPFSVDPTPMAFNIAGNENSDPSLTADGEVLVFVSRMAGGVRQGYMVTREPGSEWSVPIGIPGLADRQMESLALSWDGLTLYYVSADFALLQATRATRADPFELPAEVAGGPITWPSVSADGRELFDAQQTGGICHFRRDATNLQFGTQTQAEMFGADPYLMPSSTRMWITYDTSVAVLTRTCP